MPSSMLDLLKEVILRYRLEEDPLLRRAWIFRDGKRALIKYYLNVNEDFGIPLDEANRDLRILINVVRAALAGKERPQLLIWIYDRNPTVPYTDSLADIHLEVEDNALHARAEISLGLPSPREIRRFERLLRRLGFRGRIRRKRIEDLIKELIGASLMERSSLIKIRKVEFLSKRRELITVVYFELESNLYSVASQLIDLIKDVWSPYEIFCDILAWSGRLENVCSSTFT